jgi:hypothetical protein
MIGLTKINKWRLRKYILLICGVSLFVKIWLPFYFGPLSSHTPLVQICLEFSFFASLFGGISAMLWRPK